MFKHISFKYKHLLRLHTAKMVDVSTTSNKLLVASIDFGTTYSGWAYSFSNDFATDKCKGYSKPWLSGTHITEKTPTVVLIKPDGKTLEAFGYDAENKYEELAENGEHLKYFYFRRFKMKLHRATVSKKIRRTTMLEDEMGKPLPALEVFAMAIKYLVDDLHDTITNKLTDEVKRSDVHWVLTVPAIWTDAAKQFMREAAEKAGISRNRLSIALEPEAASVYCRHLSIDNTDESINSLPAGTKYMILDAGGGTIDITVHEVNADQGVKEITSASGGGWGGTLVDQAFENLIKDFVGHDVYERFKLDETEDWLDLFREFEMKKRNVRPDGEGRITMRFPSSLSEMSEKNRSGVNAEKYAGNIDVKKDKITFSNNIFKQLFENSYSKTLEQIDYILKQPSLEDLKLILMVGGYSASPMLQQAVMRTFPDMKVVIPQDASSAVMKGALICGHQPEFITQRVLKYTYGVRSRQEFIEGKHPESRRIKTKIGDRCSGCFSKHVEKNQVVNVGETQVQKRYTRLDTNEPPEKIVLYASTLQNPEFIDSGCFKIGILKVDVKPEDLEDGVLVSFTFGGTEVKVEAVISKTGEIRSANIDLLA